MKTYFFSALLSLSTVNSFATDNDAFNFEIRSPFDFGHIKVTIPRDNSLTWKDIRAATFNKIMDLKKDDNLQETYIMSKVKYHNNIGLMHSHEIVTSFLKLNEPLPSFEASQTITLYFVARKVGENYWETHGIQGLTPGDIQLKNTESVEILQKKWINERLYINDNNLVDGINKVLLSPAFHTTKSIISSKLSCEAITEIKEMTKEFYPTATESNPVVEYVKDFLEN